MPSPAEQDDRVLFAAGTRGAAVAVSRCESAVAGSSADMQHADEDMHLHLVSTLQPTSSLADRRAETTFTRRRSEIRLPLQCCCPRVRVWRIVLDCMNRRRSVRMGRRLTMWRCSCGGVSSFSYTTRTSECALLHWVNIVLRLCAEPTPRPACRSS